MTLPLPVQQWLQRQRTRFSAENIKREIRTLEFWLKFAAYAIPLVFLLYVLYMNFLPFGYSKTFTINVGAEGDTDSSQEFYLEPSRDLSERKTAEDGTTYRELNGSAFAVFKPKAVLKDAEVTVSVEGDGVSLIPPVIDFDPNSVKWDYSWDFTKEIPKDLKGNAFHFDDGAYFDGKSKLELPNSADMFEEGPFTVYAEWKPENDQDNFQQIVGHYNWELVQGNKSIMFQIGRMNRDKGPFYSIEYPILKDFFGKKHNALALYNPTSKINPNGYIDLFVDNTFSGRTYINKDIIWKEYNGIRNLGFGKAGHGIGSYYKGNLYNVRYSNANMLTMQKKASFNTKEGNNILILSDHTLKLNQLNLHASKE